MMRATIRQIETRTETVKGPGLPEVQAELDRLTPAGFDLVNSMPSMSKTESTITAEGTYARRDGLQEIVGESLADIRSKTPEGWQILNVIRE